MAGVEFGRAFPHVLRDTETYPYRVNYRGVQLASIIIVFGLVMVGALFGAWTLIGSSTSYVTKAGLLCLWMVVAGVCAYRLWLLRAPWLVLYPDRLENRSLTGWRTLNRSDIEGVRAAGADRNGAWFEVVSRRADLKGVRLREQLRKDDPKIKRWFEGVRDLTAEAVAADRSAILADPRYGASHDERARRFALAKTAATSFNVAAFGVAAFLYLGPSFFPVPAIAILAAAIGSLLLGACLVLASNGLILWIAKDKARPQIIAAFTPAVAMGYAAFNLHLIHAMPVQIAAVVLGLGAAALWFIRSQSSAKPWSRALAVGLFSALMAYGLISFSDIALDQSLPHTFPVRVFAKGVSGSRSRSYNLMVTTWSDQPSGDISVPSAFYEATSIDSFVCLVRHDGALGVGWFDVQRCPPGTEAPKPKGEQFYPAAAQRAGKEGSAMVQCIVNDEMHLSECHAISETPQGYGFGEAATARVNGMTLKPGSASQRSTFKTRVTFKLAG